VLDCPPEVSFGRYLFYTCICCRTGQVQERRPDLLCALVRLVCRCSRHLDDLWSLLGYFLAHDNRPRFVLDAGPYGHPVRSGPNWRWLCLPDSPYHLQLGCSLTGIFGSDLGISRTTRCIYF